MKVLSSESRVAFANYFFSINFTHQMVGKASAIVDNFQSSFQLLKLTLTLLMLKKGILKVISIFMLANKKIFSKNQDFLSLSSIKKKAITIAKVSSQLPLIFWVQIIVFQMWRLNFLQNLATLHLFCYPCQWKL